MTNTSIERTNNDSDNQHIPLWQQHLSEEEIQDLLKHIQLAESSTRGLVTVVDDPYGRRHRYLRVVMNSATDATHEEIRAAIPALMQLTDYLKQKALLLIPAEETYILWSRETYLQMSKKRRMSYGKIAIILNERISYYLNEYHSKHPPTESDSDKLRNRGDYDYAVLDMQTFGFTREQADSLFAPMLEEADDHPVQFEKGYPISKDRVIQTLKRWSKSPDRDPYKRAIERESAVE